MTVYTPFYGRHPDPARRAPKTPHLHHGQGCCVCGSRPCLRAVGRSGYCGLHTREAFEAARVVKEGAR